MSLRIHLISPALPPALDGIGDYSALLAAELAKAAHVTVLSATGATPNDIANVKIIPAFSPSSPLSVREISSIVAADCPDWVVLQFNQFSYGRWGLNPILPMVMRSIARRCPHTRVAVMFHEDFVPPTSWKFRIMRLWQKQQFKSLGRSANVVFFSIQAWANRYRNWFGGQPVIHLPVGSNIPLMPADRDDVRAKLGFKGDQLVLGLFGSGHSAEMLQYVRAAAHAVRDAGHDASMLYVGTNGKTVQDVLGDFPMRDEGPLGAGEVSRRLRAMDVYLTPFADGISTRRGSMLAGIQHGLATVGTVGPHTDDVLRVEDGRSLLLAPLGSRDAFVAQALRLAGDVELRRTIGQSAAALYQREFTWPIISRQLLDGLNGRAIARSAAVTAEAQVQCASA